MATKSVKWNRRHRIAQFKDYLAKFKESGIPDSVLVQVHQQLQKSLPNEKNQLTAENVDRVLAEFGYEHYAVGVYQALGLPVVHVEQSEREELKSEAAEHFRANPEWWQRPRFKVALATQTKKLRFFSPALLNDVMIRRRTICESLSLVLPRCLQLLTVQFDDAAVVFR